MKPITVEMIGGEFCNGGRSAMVLQHHCRSSGGGGLQWGKVCNITPALIFTSEEYFILLLSLDLSLFKNSINFINVHVYCSEIDSSQNVGNLRCSFLSFNV